MAQPLVILCLAVLAGVVPTAIYVLVLWWCDRYEKEPAWLFTLAFLWGALPGTMLALLLEVGLALPLGGAAGPGELLQSSTVGPLVEEGVKGAALLAIFLLYRREFDGVLDGIIYGGVVGFGFAMTENILYFLEPLARGGLGAFGLLWVMRALIFGLNHALFAAITGIGLGLARLARRSWQRWLAPLAAFAAAVALHATHNLFAGLMQVSCWSVLGSLLSDWGGLSVVAAVLCLSWRQEQRWIHTHLASEVAGGVIGSEEYTALSSPWRRWGRDWETLSHAGWQAMRAGRRRAAWATELAFKKAQLAFGAPAAGEAAAIEKLRALLLAGRGHIDAP